MIMLDRMVHFDTDLPEYKTKGKQSICSVSDVMLLALGGVYHVSDLEVVAPSAMFLSALDLLLARLVSANVRFDKVGTLLLRLLTSAVPGSSCLWFRPAARFSVLCEWSKQSTLQSQSHHLIIRQSGKMLLSVE